MSQDLILNLNITIFTSNVMSLVVVTDMFISIVCSKNRSFNFIETTLKNLTTLEKFKQDSFVPTLEFM